MSHHFDNPNAGDDPRLNVNDYYLFAGAPGTTVMAMTVNPDAGLSAPETLRDEGLYAFRYDLNGDNVEEITFKFRFSAPTHGTGDEHTHIQTYEVRRATGSDALQGADGTLILKGSTGELATGSGGVKAFVGLAPDLFAGDAVAISKFSTAFYKDSQFAPAVFQNHQNFFGRRNVTAIVLEVPSQMIGQGKVRSWATTSLYGHAPEVQVCRWGWPLFTHIFLRPDIELSKAFNSGVPADDVTRFSAHVNGVAEKWAGLAGTSEPAEYAKQLVTVLLPSVLPYELDTTAIFDFVAINGRGLGDDVMDVNLTQATNTPLGDGVAPDKARIQESFPYFGSPFSKAEQSGLQPAVPGRPSSSTDGY